ncbi:hypothetical protein Desaci_3059 [Desulfosporosinus acidiphilus SJ4]|uniref:Uncharacterized protein n=1 Tax=Desulfosporosinus acidiphilus (strain DSM 22704 / JCM 16185 / SJ4) TaxID=646529 RepID=I4D842_DESAJ|nr:hypothetical protein [Desulfosporosinus acidiphilus]AFM41966.1 hypothetical protein Desaci_3059 [Desulfosporosinus acidiphilus SJ4]
MSKNKTRRDELAQKYPEVEQHFQNIKQEMNEPQIERLGETKKEQKERTEGHWNPS